MAERFIKCPRCGVKINREWKRCPECGQIIHPEEPTEYYPLHLVERGKLDHLFKGRKEYLRCTVCGRPIKEESSYHDKKMKVFLHVKCKPKFMEMIKKGEIE